MKIVGIGLGRTGTSSLHKAFQILEYKSIHGLHKLHPNVISDINHSTYGYYDCFCDTPYYYLFDMIDKNYQCKFIYTYRDLDLWLNSMYRLFEHYKKQWSDNTNLHHINFYGEKDFNLKLFTDAYHKHNEYVNQYFKNREADLLRINITTNDSDMNWKQLCEFLIKNIPNQPFPNVNNLINP